MQERFAHSSFDEEGDSNSKLTLQKSLDESLMAVLSWEAILSSGATTNVCQHTSGQTRMAFSQALADLPPEAVKQAFKNTMDEQAPDGGFRFAELLYQVLPEHLLHLLFEVQVTQQGLLVESNCTRDRATAVIPALGRTEELPPAISGVHFKGDCLSPGDARAIANRHPRIKTVVFQHAPSVRPFLHLVLPCSPNAASASLVVVDGLLF